MSETIRIQEEKIRKERIERKQQEEKEIQIREEERIRRQRDWKLKMQKYVTEAESNASEEVSTYSSQN